MMIKVFYRCLFFFLAGTSLVWGQDASGTIGGMVLDPSNSAVPNAKVTLTDVNRSQVVRTVTTNASGNYAATFLPVGTYAVKVEAPGFKTEEQTQIVLNSSDDLKINIKLQVGSTNETVEVTADVAAVELGSPASATTIEGKQISELALGTRNYEALVALMPGVASNAVDDLYVGNSLPSGAANTVPFSINGQRNSSNSWTVDGADNVDRGSNQTLSTFPSVDAISQFKVERTAYTADTGRAGGANINVVTKSGTKSFHGTIYEFFRNDALNANLWSNNANNVNVVNGKAKITPVRWNDYGFTIGGPIYIPGKFNKEKNKTFFFYSQEWRRIINYATFNPTAVPTTGMLTGNMLQPVCVQFSGTTCVLTGTQIAPSLFNPNSQAYIKDIFSKLPLLSGTTVAATTSLFAPVRNIYNSRQEMGRIDHQFNDRFSIWGRFTIDDIPTTEAGGLFSQSSVPLMATTQTNSPGRGAVIHFVNILTPTINNDAYFNFSQSAIVTVPLGLSARANSPDINPALAFPNPEGVVPTVAFTSGSSANGAGPYNDYNRNYAWFDNLYWTRGRHSVKFGVSVNRYQKTENANSGQGTFTFTNTGVPTGTSAFQPSWANFLLGTVATFTQPSMDVTPNVWSWQTEAYVQDDYKMTPRLTLFYGVRWSFFGQPTDAGGLMDNFDPILYNKANAPKIDPATGNVVPGTVGWQTNGIIIGGKNSPYGDTISNNTYKNFAPRLGLAWDPVGDGKTAIRMGYGMFYDATLFGTYEQNIFADPPIVSSVTYTNTNFSNVTAGTAGISPLGPLATSVLTLHATQIPNSIPYSQQWNFTIQHRFKGGWVLTTAYVGSKGTHLLALVDINEAYPGLALAAGLHAAGTNTVFTSTDQAHINAVRPYQGFGPINALETQFDSSYNSLQTQLQKNFGGAGLIGLSYTYSKVMTDAGSDRSNTPQNTYNFSADRGPAPFNRTQVLTANYVYTIPTFRHSAAFIRQAIGGWELSGIISAYTGQPSTVSTSSVDPAGVGLLANTGNISNRPDQTCDGNANAPHQYGGAAQEAAQGLNWFNTKCWANVPQGLVRPGNTGRYTVVGPGFFNWDASLYKNFSLTGDGRIKLQMRGETFNALNWVNPLGFASTNITATNFGQISSFRAARRMQIGAKIIF
ncbi:MAG TPA: carboxypeptidase regulatory-like domain-containing protein [Bryobacteraceae bacterium]